MRRTKSKVLLATPPSRGGHLPITVTRIFDRPKRSFDCIEWPRQDAPRGADEDHRAIRLTHSGTAAEGSPGLFRRQRAMEVRLAARHARPVLALEHRFPGIGPAQPGKPRAQALRQCR